MAVAFGSSAAALDTINITAIKPKAFESDTVNGQGEFAITRSSAIGTVTVNFTLSGTASPTLDYTLAFAPRGTWTRSTGTVTFQPGENSVTVRVVAVADAPVAPPELGETVQLTVIADPAYVVGNRQTDVVTVIDADVTGRVLVDLPIPAEMLQPTPPQTATAPPGRERLWFEQPYSVYADRGIEVMLAGTATLTTDYSMVWKIGGGISGTEGIGEGADQPYAYRLLDEYGRSNGAPSSILAIGGTRFPNDAKNKRITKIGGTTGTWNIDTMVDASPRMRIDFNPAMNFDIINGAGLTLQYEQDVVVGSALQTITFTVTDWQVDNPVMYAAGVTSVAVSGGAFGALYVGDVIQFAGDPNNFYRITGPQNVGYDRNPNHPSGNLPVNKDHNLQAVASRSAGPAAFISFTPRLRSSIMRTGGGAIITHFPTAFPQSRQTVFIPKLPFLRSIESPVYPQEFPNDMPKGDYVDFYLTAVDDTLAEGAETVTLTVQTGNANNGYDILDPTVGTMVIADNDVVASIEATQNATEGGASGQFKVTLSQAFPPGRDIAIPYVLTTQGLSNPATAAGAGKDFTIAGFDTINMRGSIIIPGGSKEAFITVVGIDDDLTEGNEQIKLTLGDSNDYLLAGSVSGDVNANGATMNIADAVGKLSVTAATPRTMEGSTTPAVFRINLARNPGQTGALSVDYRITGSASSGRDYLIQGGPVVIPSGQDFVELTVLAFADTAFDPEETVILTLQGSAGLIDSAQSSATIVIGEQAGTTNSTKSTAVVEKNGGGCGLGASSGIIGMLLMLAGFARRAQRKGRAQ
ncbi:MAG: hypothetical protein H0W83_11925 [Planctomycetes bacterium]|nr:hypothetical protein [Planctomycetota bacterium]